MNELELLIKSFETVRDVKMLREIYAVQAKRKIWSKDEMEQILAACRKRKVQIYFK